MTVAPALVQLHVVDWADPRAVGLRRAMDEEVGPRYADRFDNPSAETAAELAQAFAIDPDTMVLTLIATVDGVPAAHAALRMLGTEYELKRLVTLPEYRGRGLSKALIRAIESAAAERGARRLILQTGDRQPEAVRLYEHLGYSPIPIYPPYSAIWFSLCYERMLPA
ncbi:GNAT family N-acetyltransferase [Cryobacterium sp. PAMC25264]|uniref:GNAT family N-acetyltransferase n=1 Tax=Cryobacterium sp. PAMC25264 TaxID=2861288 RepID=UPI001C62CA35|nr:GNAT family N-acetyltransferase [Cryobacterium sp. PAMC25264]QYF73942.1 GNAT family N-acetyltransferase [Cryobacterium sp. PAMC25264]